MQVQTCMKTVVFLSVIVFYGLAGCTTAGAPQPGERAEQMLCEAGDLKVCTGFTGSRIKTERGTCSCN